MYESLVARIRYHIQKSESYGQKESALQEAAYAIDSLEKSLMDCRNELCLKCGDYKQRHLGACDGCRWLER